MKLLRVKTENLLALLYLPIGIINITKVRADFIIIAILMQFLLIAVLFYGIRETRHELIRDIKAGEYEEELETIKNAIATIRRIKGTIATKLEDIKKRSYRKQTKNDQVKRCFLKYNF